LRETNLRESGYQMEERHYLIMRRGVSTIFIYVAPAGEDLYISRSTSILCSISTWRVVIMILLALIVFFSLCSFLTTVASLSQGGVTAAIGGIFSTFLFLPLSAISVAVLLWYLVRSFSYWLREKDFKVYLRSLIIKDFELDDIMLLEHAADMTIRAAVEGLGLDATKITAPEEGYKQNRRVQLL
jgi:hypothetical protein